MLKSVLKLSAAGLIGGMLSLSFLYFFPINENHTKTAVNSSEKITEKENEIQAVNAIPNVNYEKANLDFTSAAEKTVNSVVHIQSTYLRLTCIYFGHQIGLLRHPPHLQKYHSLNPKLYILCSYLYLFIAILV